MKILLTGASSFTGFWFATSLADAGHQVHVTLTRDGVNSYGDVRRHRITATNVRCRPHYSCRFGDERFIKLLNDECFDLLCHHAADVTNYRSNDFAVCEAVANNTHQIQQVLATFRDRGGKAAVFTGSIFEGGEGIGSQGTPHFSPYGLSKALTAQIAEYYCRSVGLAMGKFVIPNPFGPWEDPRFTAYLIRSWKAQEIPHIKTPDYIRDNIHISLLAETYVAFAEKLAESSASSGLLKCNPSGYIETQGAFAERVASELRPRLGWLCEVSHAKQEEFTEPLIRVNTDSAARTFPDWDEARAWDQFAEYYLSTAK